MMRIWLCLLMCLAWAGCGQGGSYSLTLILPEDAKDQTSRIRVAVVEPGPTATCEALVLREVDPGQAGYTIEDEISFDYPVTQAVDQLQELGPGQRLFYAEGINTFGGIIVNGCTRLEAGGVGPRTVTIELAYLADGSCSNELLDGHCLIDDACYSTGEASADSSCRTCDPAYATDAWTLKADGESCDDGLWCSGLDTCSAAGDCVHTALPCTDRCFQNCSESEQSCSEDLSGTLCDDGFSCTQADACDGAGNCVGTPIVDYCAANEECQPACATDQFGCVARPNWINLSCPDIVPFDTPAACSIILVNGEGSEACASCSVRLVPSIVSQTDFFSNPVQDCTLGDWQLEDHSCTTGSAWCPFTSGGADQACCNEVACHTEDHALDFLPGQCGPDNGWRFSQLFALDSFEQLRLCYQIMQRSPSVEGSLQLMADKNDGSDPVVLACDQPDAWHDSLPTETCVEMPLAMGDWPSTRLTFWVQLGQLNSEILLEQASLYGFPPECNQQQVVFDTSFDGCGQDAAGHDGWTFSPSGTCEDGRAECGFTGGLLVDGNNPSVIASHDLIMPDLRPPAKLCWSHYHSPGFNGEYTIAISGGAGKVWYVQIYRSKFPAMALNSVCRDFCIDLSQFGGSIFGTGNTQISISAQAPSGGTLLINEVRIEASTECDATGILQAGPVEPDGQGGFQVQVNNLQNLPRRALLECHWGDGAVHASREIEFSSP
ncbi:MAG: hypothetical protein JRJ87_23795 [Deltaproteobacteria bacterium]|nr:hypothetical protein [Deltaproteobacteria bacterium]